MTLYRTIVADPPWPMRYDGKGKRSGGTFNPQAKTLTSKQGLGYPTMTVDAICALPVSDLAAADAHLFVWIPDVFLIAGHGARVIGAWGFKPGRLIVWRKSHFGLGTFPRPQHECVITAKRGSLPYTVANVGSVGDWHLSFDPRFGRPHSQKPEGFLDVIEQASPGPYLELFSRRARLGWDTWGDEALGGSSLASPVSEGVLGQQRGTSA